MTISRLATDLCTREEPRDMHMAKREFRVGKNIKSKFTEGKNYHSTLYSQTFVKARLGIEARVGRTKSTAEILKF